MGGRFGRASIATACVVAAAAACRQIVGIGDAPPGAGAGVDAAGGTGDAGAEGGAACGIVYAGAACEACLEQRCCAQATACSGRPGCSALESCLGACGGDPACRARCSLNDHTTDPAEPTFSACLVHSCGGPCGLQCGGLAQEVDPDAASSCQDCIGKGPCDTVTACAADPECAAIAWCALATPALDVRQACEGAHDGGIDQFIVTEQALRSACLGPCALGNQWYCLGHLAHPVQSNPATTVSVTVTDFLQSTPAAGVTVKVCSPLLPPCTSLGEATTDDAGTAVVSVPTPTPGGYGPTGYLDVSGAGVFEELYSWIVPLSEPSVHFPLSTATPVELAGAFAVLGGVTLDPQRAQLIFTLTDCDLVTVPGAIVQVSPSDSETTTLYPPSLSGGALLDASGIPGLVAVLNVPADAGTATVTVFPGPLDGGASTVATLPVGPGIATTATLVPTQ